MTAIRSRDTTGLAVEPAVASLGRFNSLSLESLGLKDQGHEGWAVPCNGYIFSPSYVLQLVSCQGQGLYHTAPGIETYD